jgi:tetratricopeptide (TPR) repeat protein
LRAQRFEPAVAAFHKAAEAVPNDRRALVQLALAQSQGGDYLSARATTEAMLRRFPDDPVVQLAVGRCLLECEDSAGAEPLLRSAAESQPENALAQQYRALCELARGDLAAAAEHFERVGLAANADFLALFSYVVERRLAPTIPAADKDAPPPSESCAAQIAQLDAQATNPASGTGRAKRKHRRALRMLSKLGERAFDAGDFAAALAAFAAASRGGSEEMIVWLGAGLSSLRLDRPNSAAEFLSKAYARWPDDGLIGSSYADALYRAGRIAESLAVFERIEPAGPDDFHAHYGRGACLAVLGQKPAALAQFRAAFRRFRLDTMDNCLLPSWEALQRRQSAESTSNNCAERRPPD